MVDRQGRTLGPWVGMVFVACSKVLKCTALMSSSPHLGGSLFRGPQQLMVGLFVFLQNHQKGGTLKQRTHASYEVPDPDPSPAKDRPQRHHDDG